MINKQFIVDDINDFLKPNNHQWKTYFDRAECKAILDAIEKSNKYEKMTNAWLEVMNELEILIRGCDIVLEDNDDIQSVLFYGGKMRAYEKVIDIINQKLEIEE